MPGPPPKPASERRRRNAPIANTTRLPARRDGSTPRWPLSKARPGELAKWRRLWELPQAVYWERVRCEDVVARYVRTVIDAEEPDAPMSVRKAAQDLEDRLGLNPMAMLRLRLEVAADEVADARESVVPARRLKAVDADAVARG